MAPWDVPPPALSAFTLTPMHDQGLDGRIDEPALARLVRRAAQAGVEEIGVLGSTGIYPYLSLEQRRRAVEIAAHAAPGVPLTVGIGAFTTHEVARAARDAHEAGASQLMLAPVSYHPLTEDEVFGLYRDIAREADLPLVVYDAPRTTGFTFTYALYARIAELPGIGAFKLPGTVGGREEITQRTTRLRAMFPPHIRLGTSGDAFAGTALAAGFDIWYSALAGTLPGPMLRLAACAVAARAGAEGGGEVDVEAEWERLAPLWELVSRLGGTIRVATALAQHRGLIAPGSLPLPLLPLGSTDYREVIEVAESLGLWED